MSRSGKYTMLTQIQQKLKEEGKAYNNISLLSRETGFSRDTIRKYLQEGVVPHKSKGITKGSKLDPYKDYLDEQFECKNFNCESLYDRIKDLGYDGGLTILRDYVRSFRPPPQAISIPERTMRFETTFGEQAQMDWGFARYFDERTKRMKLVGCLVVVSGASRKRFIEFFSNCRQENLFIGIIHAFQYFGGIFETILTDGMKSIFDKRRGKIIIYNSHYERFMAELGFSTRLCKIKTPQTKGKSERLVDYVKNNFFPGRTFQNLVDLNVQASKWSERVNSKVHGTTGLIPNEEHIKELKHLRPLPPDEILNQYLWPYRKVSLDGMVSYEGCSFGIIYSCKEKRVRIRRFGSQIRIIDSFGETIGQYEAVAGRKMYFHPEQWPNDYYRNNWLGKRRNGYAIQKRGATEFYFGTPKLQAYDDVLKGGGF